MQSFINVDTPGVYTVTISNACEHIQESYHVELAADARENFFYVPNVFSPNNDGMNDFWQIMPPDDLEVLSFELHNFMDEPLTGLDANMVIMVKEIISRLSMEGKTIFYSSHMMDIVEKVSDRIVLINKGSIVADGSFEESKKQGGENLESVFAQLTGDQYRGNKADDFLDSISE